jgi:DNA-binding MarR family transcriptional regulator
MRDLATREEILEKIATDLLSIPSLLFRQIRRKLVKTALAGIDVDITPLHFEILGLLEKEGKLHVAEIGEKLHIAKAQMTHLIDKLADFNMIERKTDMADRRTINVTLTSRGRAFLEGRKKRLVRSAMDTMSGLTDEEVEDLANTLKKLRDILSKLQ